MCAVGIGGGVGHRGVRRRARQAGGALLTLTAPSTSGYRTCGDGSGATATRAAGSPGGAEGAAVLRTEAEVALRASLPPDRGIFGMSSGARAEVDGLVRALEALNPTGPEPLAGGAEVLRERVDGTWRVLYTTVSIQGKRRTQLGLRVFVELGEFLQIIDADTGSVRNVIAFDALGKIRGALTVNAAFRVASGSRVDVDFTGSDIEPQGLRDIFQENYELLLAIFDPSGWLETTYLDPAALRVGRDDKGNVFVLERVLRAEDA